MAGRQPELMQRRDASIWKPTGPVWGDTRAWICSCALHTVVFVLLALLWQPRTRGTGDWIDRPVGIAVFHETGHANEYELSGGPAAASGSTASGANAAVVTVADSSGPPVSVSDLMKDLVGYAGDGASATTSGTGLGDGLSGAGTSGSGAGNGAGETSASFMGLQGTGASFVYVLDRSASMEEFGGTPMRFAKDELLRSIQSLRDNHQFQVVFYNESPGSLAAGSTGGKMLAGNEANKEKAARFVKAIRPLGGTEHIPGLKMGLSFGPDVLFFLTDAAEPSMSEAQLLEIQSRAERSMTTIHAVQFNRGEAVNDGGWIRALAEMNRGTYRYVDISSLP
jgi:hypothetical protein